MFQSVKFQKVQEHIVQDISEHCYPERLALGSSGSYVCYRLEPGGGKKGLAIFKPQDEEPYAMSNPKWIKWLHRVLCPCFYGRSCLVPNMGFASEAAAYVVASRLGWPCLVPETHVVKLGSPTFFYPNLGKNWQDFPPPKLGSLQLWISQTVHAAEFFQKHPWTIPSSPSVTSPPPPPLTVETPLLTTTTATTTTTMTPLVDFSSSTLPLLSPSTPTPGQSEINIPIVQEVNITITEEVNKPEELFVWSTKLRRELVQQVQQLIVFDFIIRNTDRNMENWLIRLVRKEKQSSIFNPEDPILMEPSTPNTELETQSYLDTSDALQSGIDSVLSSLDSSNCDSSDVDESSDNVNKRQMEEGEIGEEDLWQIQVVAIDHGLAFPYKHPDRVRNYPFGWLWLEKEFLETPIEKEMSERLLRLLKRPSWWRETERILAELFVQSKEYHSTVERRRHERWFKGQISVMKGQAWTLRRWLSEGQPGGIAGLCERRPVVVPRNKRVERGRKRWVKARPIFTCC